MEKKIARHVAKRAVSLQKEGFSENPDRNRGNSIVFGNAMAVAMTKMATSTTIRTTWLGAAERAEAKKLPA